jgi:hypothetical protein
VCENANGYRERNSMLYKTGVEYGIHLESVIKEYLTIAMKN